MPTLKLFGGILLEDERGLLNATAQRRPLALLALLAVSHPRPVSRDKLIGYLWAERDLSSARNVLNQVTHTLRRALGGGVVVSAGDELRLESGSVTVDVNDFEGALAAGELERAVRLYSGPLLDGFFLTGAPEFERWLEDQRERFRRAYCRALERLAEAAELGGDPPVAAEWWKRLALEEPHSSRVMLRLMQTLAATGDSAEAIRHARGHAARLRDELDMEPALEVTVLAERLRRVVPAVLPSASDPADLTDAGAGAPPVPRSATALDSSSGAPVADPVAASFSAQEIQDVLGLSASPPLRRFPPPRVRAQAAMVLVAIISLMMIPAAWWLRRPIPYSLNPQRVLVTDFDNQTGDPRLDPIGRMAADWIARGLMEHRGVEVVSTATFLLAGNDATERGIRELAQETGAGTVVSGTYYLDGGVLRLQAQITDTARGRLLHTLGPIGVPVDSATLAAELLRQRMAAVLAARFDFSHELREITASGQPPTYAAYVAYLEGAELFFRNQIPRAIERFEQAWVLDTTFYLPQLYNALMYWNLDLLAEMDSVVHDLSPRRDRFSPLERLWLEHFEALIAGDNELALRTIRQMAEVAPGSWLGGQSALALMTNRPREALHALLQADLERGFLRNWGYYWFLRTTARHMLGQHRQELAEARRARLQQPELLRNRFAELRALAALGRLRELERLLEESRLLPADPEWTPADLLRSTAAELRAHGHMDAAERALQDALGWYLGRPADEQPHHRAALASTLYEARRWDEARALLEELVSEQPEDLAYLGHLGALAARRGERTEAERISAMLAASTKPYLRGAHTLWRARIAALLGEREQALALLHESLAQGQTFLLRLHTDADLDPLRDYPPFRELLRPKA